MIFYGICIIVNWKIFDIEKFSYTICCTNHVKYTNIAHCPIVQRVFNTDVLHINIFKRERFLIYGMHNL